MRGDMNTATHAEFNRLKGAEWFEIVGTQDTVVGGAGGIGSWLTLFLGRIGVHRIHLYDHDQYEVHNMSGQFVNSMYVGRQKSQAVAQMVRDFCARPGVSHYGKYTERSLALPVMFSAFDNMEARKQMFENWFKFIKENPEKRNEALFIDGRLLAEQYQVFCVRGNALSQINEYYVDHLFDDGEVDAVDCTFKQTTHVAAMLASQMVSFYTNFMSNVSKGNNVRKLPFYSDHFIPLNMRT